MPGTAVFSARSFSECKLPQYTHTFFDAATRRASEPGLHFGTRGALGGEWAPVPLSLSGGRGSHPVLLPVPRVGGHLVALRAARLVLPPKGRAVGSLATLPSSLGLPGAWRGRGLRVLSDLVVCFGLLIKHVLSLVGGAS